MSPRTPLIPFLGLILLSACGSEVQADGPTGGAIRLDLVADSDEQGDRKPRQVMTLSGAKLKTVKPGPGTEVLLTENRLEVKGKNLVLTRVPRRFDRVILRVRSKGGRMNCRLLSETGRNLFELTRPAALPKQGKEVGVVAFRTEMALIHEGLIDQMEIEILNDEPNVEIHEIVFLETPREAWFPPAGTMDLVNVGFDARKGVALSPQNAMTARIPAGERETALVSFSVGTPPFLGIEEAVELDVTVIDKGRALSWSESYPVPLGEWKEEVFRIPSEAGDGELEIRFHLDAPNNAICGLSQPIVEDYQDRPKTVLLITSDTHRGDHLSALDKRVVKTPYLDQLASEGYLFEDCQSASNATNPAHFSVFTGLPVRDHALIGNNLTPSEDIPTLAEAYADAGYHTFATLSAAHLVWSGCERGFDRVFSPRLGELDSSETIRVLEKWLKESKNRSLFIWLHSFDPHGPYAPPKAYQNMYWKVKDRAGEPVEDEAPPWANKMGIDDLREIVALYKGEVTYWDSRLERLITRHPRLNNGVIALVGDHGENLIHPGYAHRFNHKALSKDTLHVPLILKFPGGKSGTRVMRPVNQEDLARTILDLSGLTHIGFPGQNLLAQIEREGKPEDISRFAVEVSGHTASVRRGDWMVIQQMYSGGKTPKVDHAVTLHDVNIDPACLVDLSGEHPELTRELRSSLVLWLDDHKVGQWGDGSAIQDEKTIANLAALGYSEAAAVSGDNPWIDIDCTCESCQQYPILRQ